MEGSLWRVRDQPPSGLGRTATCRLGGLASEVSEHSMFAFAQLKMDSPTKAFGFWQQEYK